MKSEIERFAISQEKEEQQYHKDTNLNSLVFFFFFFFEGGDSWVGFCIHEKRHLPYLPPETRFQVT